MPKRVIKKGGFSIDLYKVDVEIYIMATNRDVSSHVKRLHKKFGYTDEGIEEDACGYALTFMKSNPGVFYMFISSEDLTVNTITHEADHIRTYIIEYLGLSEDLETSANLNGLINEKVFRFLRKNNLEIKY